MIQQIIKAIEVNGKSYIRFIPFDKVWNTFWRSIKEHFFLFENRKVAIIYFHNVETSDFVGPTYDAGPRFNKEDCKKKYSIYLK